jgi:hypothetical protein
MSLPKFEAQMKLIFKRVLIFTVVCSVLTHCLIYKTVLTLAAGEWLKGKNCTPVCLSMKTGSHTKTYKEGTLFSLIASKYSVISQKALQFCSRNQLFRIRIWLLIL